MGVTETCQQEQNCNAAEDRPEAVEDKVDDVEASHLRVFEQRDCSFVFECDASACAGKR